MKETGTVNILYPDKITRPTSTHRIFITDLLVDMLIGVYAHEKTELQPVRFAIEMTVDDIPHPIGDDYKNVVCYETISNAITDMAQKEHVNLVETLAEKAAAICLDHERVQLVKVKVEKLKAVKNAASVGVEIVRGKSPR